MTFSRSYSLSRPLLPSHNEAVTDETEITFGRRKRVDITIAFATLLVISLDVLLVHKSVKYYRKRYEENRPIEVLSLIGERSSGTKWIFEELRGCFNESLWVRKRLSRQKHLFQFDDGKKHNKTLVIALFRNPYDWTAAMIEKPHHAPNHLNLDWHTFLTKPWTIPRQYLDLDYIPNGTERTCQEHFRYDEVVSCNKYPFYGDYSTWNTTFSQHNPVYELRNDGSGKPYDSLLELRSDKIRNFLGTANYSYVADTIPALYEVLVSEGTASLIKQIEDITGAVAQCEPKLPRTRSQRSHDKNFLQWMTDNVDWETEALIGYERNN